MLGWEKAASPSEIMGYLPKGLSDFLKGSPGLRAFLDMEPISESDHDQQRADGGCRGQEDNIQPAKRKAQP